MNIDDSDRLKPCPFCGADAEIITLEGETDEPSIGAQCVQCTSSSCGAASGLIYPLMDDVTDLLLERWNKRNNQYDAVDVTVGRLRMIQYLRLIHAAYDADGNDLSAWAAKAADELERLANEGSDAWKEAAIGWTVCASVHEGWAKGKDALYTTRHADFERHADDARQRHALLTPSAELYINHAA